MTEVKERVRLYLPSISVHSWYGIRLILPDLNFFTPSKISNRAEHALIQGVVNIEEIFVGKIFGKLG
jgi:hypothetical protein